MMIQNEDRFIKINPNIVNKIENSIEIRWINEHMIFLNLSNNQ